MSTLIYWFRQDLRLDDNLALSAACNAAHAAGLPLIPVVCHDPQQDTITRWGVPRRGAHRRQFLAACLVDLRTQLQARGSDLIELVGDPTQALAALARQHATSQLFCEQIAAPEEQAALTALSAALSRMGCKLISRWQSTLYDINTLPFSFAQMPDGFSQVRQALEKARCVPRKPVAAPLRLPPLPAKLDVATASGTSPINSSTAQVVLDQRSSFPYQTAAFAGGETAGHAHIKQYFMRQLAHTYKATRNQLHGIDFSSKFSPWLALGCLSAPRIYAALQQSEESHGANESTYWLWFELLWRDYFRFLHLKHGVKLYRAQGLITQPEAPIVSHDASVFQRWCQGETGNALVDAGMRELAATAYLSNRMRQNVASFLVHDLACDYRAGAAWFESQLIDYDVYSNQGNWLYIAGRGTDPRGGRRFNIAKQAQEYDPDGHYQKQWKTL